MESIPYGQAHQLKNVCTETSELFSKFSANEPTNDMKKKFIISEKWHSILIWIKSSENDIFRTLNKSSYLEILFNDIIFCVIGKSI